MAKTYSEVCPDASMLIIDSAKSIGGTWAKERLYPGLKTNNIIGSYEFGDFPMTPEKFGVKAGQHIPGAVVHEYLCQFAEKFGLVSRMRLQTKVETAELQETGEWLLQVRGENTGNDGPSSLRAMRLVVATGLTSEPYVPNYAGREQFTGNFFHSRQLRDRAQDIRTSEEVVVVGANKSAWDVCYSAATSGAHVSMVIRPEGGGPSWVWPVMFSPFKLSLQRMATTRFFTLFEPCIWAESSGFNLARRLLHRTWLGRQLVRLFWKILSNPVLSANGYHTHPELRKLKPWTSMFWMGNSLGVHNYDRNWFEFVKQGRITVHVADITSLAGNKVQLSNGEVLLADTFVCCTGWRVVPPIRFMPPNAAAQLGLPGQDTAGIKYLVRKAEEEIYRTVPELRSGPLRVLPEASAPVSVSGKTLAHRPYRLYRFMIPPAKAFLDQRNIAFIGAHLALNATTVAQAQALWITAFFQREIPKLKPSSITYQDIEYQTILQSEYCRLRHPPAGGGAGERCPDLVFDGLLYTDLLLQDIEIENFRKDGLWQELFGRYLPRDYAGMTRALIDRMTYNRRYTVPKSR
ncbi:uncharacterized protein Z519_10149 [Cladophialophora bantiana CBS 173.52]|uniref:Uncharacterized protein n=1 Tax=Cladophialophora bantiana (strain ATCC 10958 / CBS 173.52 / CDC B-1940 / NIH 8579) TaxID=1442370 RepID=A0A0D2EGX0_CLAB1|nr:uncharacterized protein Z519_10149 [Cladophialophora bantiana CBS 173.52]KIW89296.1 hypothetical protein Z519_10149 [Cladophialophora bantiana CBS 173.52]